MELLVDEDAITVAQARGADKLMEETGSRLPWGEVTAQLGRLGRRRS